MTCVLIESLVRVNPFPNVCETCVEFVCIANEIVKPMSIRIKTGNTYFPHHPAIRLE